jgi:type VI secretion system ImpM family protein
MTLARLATATLFGKLPARGDFIASGERGAAETAFAVWLTRAVEAAHGKVSPFAVRFVAKGVEGTTLIGSWLASRDAVGRDFPCAVSCRLHGTLHDAAQALLLGCCAPLEDFVQSVMTSALDERVETLGQACPSPLACVEPAMRSLPERTRRAHDALASTHIHSFSAATFVECPLDNLTYALSVLQRAARTPRPELTLDIPASSDLELFVWLALLEASHTRETPGVDRVSVGDDSPTLLLWSPSLQRALPRCMVDRPPRVLESSRSSKPSPLAVVDRPPGRKRFGAQ